MLYKAVWTCVLSDPGVTGAVFCAIVFGSESSRRDSDRFAAKVFGTVSNIGRDARMISSSHSGRDLHGRLARKLHDHLGGVRVVAVHDQKCLENEFAAHSFVGHGHFPPVGVLSIDGLSSYDGHLHGLVAILLLDFIGGTDSNLGVEYPGKLRWASAARHLCERHRCQTKAAKNYHCKTG